MSVAPWSFSKIKAFEKCPKQFYHLKVAKSTPSRKRRPCCTAPRFMKHVRCYSGRRGARPQV